MCTTIASVASTMATFTASGFPKPAICSIIRARSSKQDKFFRQSETRFLQKKTTIPLVSNQSNTPTGPSPGLYSAQKFDLTVSNVDLVLEDVRPYLIADGGNVDVVSVEDGVISLRLQGPFFASFFPTTFLFFFLLK